MPPPAGAGTGAGTGVTPPVGAGAEVLKVGESPAVAVELPLLSPPAVAGGMLHPPEVAGAGVALPVGTGGLPLPPPPAGEGGLPLPSPPADADAGAGVGAPSAGVLGAALVVDLALAVKANALVGCVSSPIL